jgi:integrase
MTIDRTKYMSPEEVSHLRQFWQQRASEALKKGTSGAVRTRIVVEFALLTGLRVSEIQRVKVQDIDFDRGCLCNVKRSKKKDAKPVTLPLGAELLEHLGQYLVWEFPETLHSSWRPLFFSQRGPYSIRGLQEVWKQAVLAAGLSQDYTGIHTARRTFGTQYYAKYGYDGLLELQRLLGHAKFETTVASYVGTNFEKTQSSLNGLY